MSESVRPVLVTGGSGFIGRPLVSALLAEGVPVRVIVRRPDALRSLQALGAETIRGDVLDQSTLDRAVGGVRGIFHLAGRLLVAGSRAEDYTRLHVDAPLALINTCISHGERPSFFLMCSTTGVHGPTGVTPAAEDDIGHPQTVYEVSKAAGEQAARELASRHNFPLVIVRPGLVYGPGDLHLLGWFRAIRAGYYRVIGSGTNHLHPIFVEDAVRGLQLCADAASSEGRAYHLVGTEPVTMRQLSDAIGRAVGRPVPKRHLRAPLAFSIAAAMEALPISRRLLPLTRSRVRFMLQNRAYDGSRARSELGFVPEVGLEEGLATTVAWYRQNGLL